MGLALHENPPAPWTKWPMQLPAGVEGGESIRLCLIFHLHLATSALGLPTTTTHPPPPLANFSVASRGQYSPLDRPKSLCVGHPPSFADATGFSRVGRGYFSKRGGSFQKDCGQLLGLAAVQCEEAIRRRGLNSSRVTHTRLSHPH